MWKIYDGSFSSRQVPILTGEPCPLAGYLLGGVSGTEFLVSSRGLDQPRAGSGVVHPGVDIPFGTSDHRNAV